MSHETDEFDPSERARIRKTVLLVWSAVGFGWVIIAYLVFLWAQGQIDIQRGPNNHQTEEIRE